MIKGEIAQTAVAIDRLTTAQNLLAEMSVPQALGDPTNFYCLVEQLGEMRDTLRTALNKEFSDNT